MRALTIALCLLATPALADVAGVASVNGPVRLLTPEYPFTSRFS